MKKFLLSLVAFLMIATIPLNVLAAKSEKKETKETTAEKTEEVDGQKINVYMFYGKTCGYCHNAMTFFESIEEEYGKYFDLVKYEVWYEKTNKELMESVAEYFNDDVGGVPYIIIGDKTFGGYDKEFDEDIKKAIVDQYNKKDYVDIVAKVKDGELGKSNYDTLIVIGIFVVVIGGFGALVYFSRK